jgi:gluconate 2-dehydrogenase gamma chain
MPDSSDSLKIPRRSLLAGAALVPVTAIRSAAQTSGSVFSPAPKACLEAFVNRLVPHDEIGPGAVECGVVDYIDRSLADPNVSGKSSVLAGLDAVDALSRGTQGAPLAQLPAAKQDAVVAAAEKESPAFFTMIRRLTLEGMFCDPSWGGNRNFAGWDLIRYPGPRLAVAVEDQRVGVEIKPYRRSANGGSHGN